jgi:hypothetical protein
MDRILGFGLRNHRIEKAVQRNKAVTARWIQPKPHLSDRFDHHKGPDLRKKQDFQSGQVIFSCLSIRSNRRHILLKQGESIFYD